MSRTNRTAGRDLLIFLAESLNVSPGRLQRDPCGDWIMVGRRGHILTDGVSAYAYIPAGTARRWEKAKRRLSFMVVTQDGDAEGILRFDGMPSPTQAEAIRKAVGMRKVNPLTDAARASLSRTNFSRGKPPVQTDFVASSSVAATHPPRDTQTPSHDAETTLAVPTSTRRNRRPCRAAGGEDLVRGELLEHANPQRTRVSEGARGYLVRPQPTDRSENNGDVSS